MNSWLHMRRRRRRNCICYVLPSCIAHEYEIKGSILFVYDYFFKRKIILFLKTRVVCVRLRVYSIFLQVYRREHICMQFVRKIIVYYSTIELYLIAPSALVAQINQLNSNLSTQRTNSSSSFPLWYPQLYYYIHI